jgi:hypothetical protein
VAVAVDDIASPTAVSTDGRLGLGRLWRGLWGLLKCRCGIGSRDSRRGFGSFTVDLCRICGESSENGEDVLPHASPPLPVVDDPMTISVHASMDDVRLI